MAKANIPKFCLFSFVIICSLTIGCANTLREAGNAPQMKSNYPIIGEAYEKANLVFITETESLLNVLGKGKSVSLRSLWYERPNHGLDNMVIKYPSEIFDANDPESPGFDLSFDLNTTQTGEVRDLLKTGQLSAVLYLNTSKGGRLSVIRIGAGDQEKLVNYIVGKKVKSLRQVIDKYTKAFNLESGWEFNPSWQKTALIKKFVQEIIENNTTISLNHLNGIISKLGINTVLRRNELKIETSYSAHGNPNYMVIKKRGKMTEVSQLDPYL